MDKTTEEKCGRALELYKLYAPHYRGAKKKYSQLLKECRKKNIRPFRVLSKDVVKEYPVINFLDIISLEKAEEYLKKLGNEQLSDLIDRIEDLQFNRSYSMVQDRIAYYKSRLKNTGKRSAFGFDPTFRALGKIRSGNLSVNRQMGDDIN